MNGFRRGAVLGIFACLLGLFATSASARVMPAEVNAYRKAFDVSPALAEDRLETQARGTRGDIVGTLERGLGPNFAGVWFDNATGKFVVPLLAGKGQQVANAVAMGSGLGGEYRTPVVDDSWNELEAAQAELDSALHGLIAAGLAQTSLDPRTNAVVIDLAGAADAGDTASVRQLAARSRADVEVRESSDKRFKIGAMACEPFNFNCGKPLRGGVALYKHTYHNYWCTVGFRAKGTNGKRYVLTAGHCAGNQNIPRENYPVMHWDAADETKPVEGKFNLQYIGQLEQYKFPGNDWAKINATGSEFWDTNPWPSTIAYWGRMESETENKVLNESYPINGETSAYVGQTVCHSGATTGTSCGELTAQNVTLAIEEEGLVYHETRVDGGCSYYGDSGGPVFANNMALGLASAADLEVLNDIWPCYQATWFYTDIREATRDLDVHIYPSIETVPTETQIDSATGLNGNPGWFSIKGKVTSASSLAGTHVDVKLFKWIGSAWSEQAKLEASVNNGTYEINNWRGVGPGQWLAKVVFPAQSGLGESSSDETDEGWFTVKDGYRLLNKKSGKCLDVTNWSKDSGALAQQWECSNPQTSQNQVFTLAPKPNGYEIIARHSGRCLDVVNNSTENGARIQQWTCTGANNQIFRGDAAETVGGTDYIYLVAQNSQRCLDVIGGSTANGAGIQQWGCSGAGQQKWTLQSVDSAPVPTETFLSIDGWLHGEYGYVFLSGNVKVGAYPIAGQQVKVEFEKESSPGNWEKVPGETLWVPIDGTGHYEYSNWGIGKGKWRAFATFPGNSAQPALASSSSGTHGFEIRGGYRFVSRYSGKCMTLSENKGTNGQAIIQWPCSSTPSPGDGQYFNFVAQPNGYYNLKIRSTGKCVDVTNGSTSDGAWLQQWDCLGANQANQLWDKEPIATESGYFAFIAKHSGKCADLTGPSMENGKRIQQWTCNWTNNQRWDLEAVG
jgi:hypothetical protein